MAAVVARLPGTTDLSEQQTWRQIDAGDEILRDTLNEAIIPALMTAMVHLTGKADIIRGTIRSVAKVFADLPWAGIPPEQQQKSKSGASIKGRLSMNIRCMVTAMIAMCWAISLAAAPVRDPNILIIVADDLGYADLGFQGGTDIPTPGIDALAANGVRFSNGYVTGTWCSPTRAGLLTGRYQQRFGDAGHEPIPDNGLSLAETTLADRLSAAGYVTGLVGKWHLGIAPEFHPFERGFDEFFGFLRGGHSFQPGLPLIIFPDRNGLGEDFRAIEEGRTTLDGQIFRGAERVAVEEYLTDAFAREAVSFIERHEKDPFFLLLSFNAVHTPMHATDDRLEKFGSIADPMRRIYAAMTLAMDEAVGRVMSQLGQSNLEQDTLVFFISDNGGPTVHKYAYNASATRRSAAPREPPWKRVSVYHLSCRGQETFRPVRNIIRLPYSSTSCRLQWQRQGLTLPRNGNSTGSICCLTCEKKIPGVLTMLCIGARGVRWRFARATGNWSVTPARLMKEKCCVLIHVSKQHRTGSIT